MENVKNNDFEFAQKDAKLTDLKFDTKPIGYFKDAWLRFKKSKASVVGAIIILLIVIYAIITPLVSPNSTTENFGVYSKMQPYNSTLAQIGLVDGTYSKKCNNKAYSNLLLMGVGAEDVDGNHQDIKGGSESFYNPLKKTGDVYLSDGVEYRQCRVQSYLEIGFRFLQVTKDEYQKILDYETSSGLKVIYPMIDTSQIESLVLVDNRANYWYKTSNLTPVNESGNKITDLNNTSKVQDIYLRDSDGNVQYSQNIGSNSYNVRVLYWNYFQYFYGKAPNFLLGTDGTGYDIAVRLASGIGLSLILSISTFIINFIIGAIYGSIEGYYGGVLDLIMERISDILNSIPFIVLASIVNESLIQTGKMDSLGALIFAFVLLGWIGPAYRVRTQFYRFKNQEYVLAARTLGASDARIMFKHIFPNTLGTIITSSVLTIPGTIFTESMLSYLGIINLNAGAITSLGTMLSNGQQYLTTYPHIIAAPAVIISLLMISFNLFGNGLRDAFNPSLRGVEE